MMKKVNISQVDVLFLNWTYPIEFLLFFTEGLDTKKLRKALKRLSSVFWPIFGEHGDGLITFEKYVEDDFYNEKVISQNFMIPETEGEKYEVYSRYSPPELKKLVGTKKEFKDESFELTIPIDVRRQVKEYGRRFFGNGIMLHTMRLKKSDLENLAVEDIAVQIRKSMPAVSKQSYIEYLKKLEEIISEGKTEKLRPFDPTSGCLVTNISRIPVDKLDFGIGPPDLIFPLTIEKNAAAVLAKDENFILRFVY
jgi:hypothetical protein